MSMVKPDQVINTVYDSISKSVIESMQSAQSLVFTSQDINVRCDDVAVASMTEDVDHCIETLINKKKDKKTVKKLCKPVIQCIANNISMVSSLNVTDLTNQTASIQSNIENSMTNNITQNLNSLDQSLLLGDTNKTNIENITNLVKENTQEITQAVYDSVTQQQGLTLNNYSANNITIDSVSEVVIKNVQNIDGVQSIVTDISNDIIQTLSSNTDSLTSWVIKIMSVFLGIVGLIFFILYIVKRKDTGDFIRMVMPYGIFIIGVIMIVSIHLLFKPDYIMSEDHREYREIDTGKFIFWTVFYSIILFVMEYIYFNIIKT